MQKPEVDVYCHSKDVRPGNTEYNTGLDMFCCLFVWVLILGLGLGLGLDFYRSTLVREFRIVSYVSFG